MSGGCCGFVTVGERTAVSLAPREATTPRGNVLQKLQSTPLTESFTAHSVHPPEQSRGKNEAAAGSPLPAAFNLVSEERAVAPLNSLP